MNKRKAKTVLHWLGFSAAVIGAGYIAFVAPGLSIAEKITLAATSLGGLFVALGKVFPVIERAVDQLPDDTAIDAVRLTTIKPLPKDPS